MTRTTHQKLVAALDVMIGGEGSLPFRLFCIGTTMSALSPDAFDGHRLRRQFRRLKDDFTMLGLLGGDDDGRPWEGLRIDDAMTLAVRVIDLCVGVALREDQAARGRQARRAAD